MAPKSSPPQPSLSQKTKQQTISSFFTPKPSQASTTASRAAAPASRPALNDTANRSDDLSSDAPRRKRPVLAKDGDLQEAAPASKRIRSATSYSDDEGDGTPSDRISLGNASDAGLNVTKAKKIPERTSKYIFSSSPPGRDENEAEDDAASQRQKEQLHEKFVKKLGRPDSFAELRRKNKIISEESAEGNEGEDAEEEEEEAPKPTKGRKGAAAKSASKLTPMEKQYLEIKRKHLDTVIVMEVGYKFKFFGEDARIASKELGIVCIPGKFRYDERESNWIDSMGLYDRY